MIIPFFVSFLDLKYGKMKIYVWKQQQNVEIKSVECRLKKMKKSRKEFWWEKKSEIEADKDKKKFNDMIIKKRRYINI